MAKDTVNEFDSENIFDDFSSDKWLGKDIKDLEKEESRDLYFYLKLISSFFKFINIILFLVIFVYFFYNYIQKNEELESHDFLNPICSLILWSSADKVNWCYSITSYLAKEKDELAKKEKEYAQDVIDIIWNAYTMDNFINSKSILFLSNKSKNKFNPLKIFSDFNILKNKFDSTKSKVVCENLFIKDNNLSLSCNFYTSDWEDDIKNWSKEDKEISWTSVSLALSFMDFIENNKESKFSIINKPKTFSAWEYLWVWRYTKVTTVKLLLEYKSFDNLSL